MSATFVAETFVFRLDDGFTAVELEEGVSIGVDDLDERLLRSNKLPPLGDAPVASWVLARLSALLEKDLGASQVDHVDDGVFVIDFVVLQTSVPIAKVQLQGGQIGVGLLGVAPRSAAVGIVEAFLSALLAQPERVERTTRRVVDASVENATPQTYGFDGTSFL